MLIFEYLHHFIKNKICIKLKYEKKFKKYNFLCFIINLLIKRLHFGHNKKCSFIIKILKLRN